VIDSPGVIFDDEDEASDIKGQKKGSVLLRNVVKVEDVEDPIAVGQPYRTCIALALTADYTTTNAAEEILVRTAHSALQKIYHLPEFGSTLEFLTMLAMSSGRLLKVRLTFPSN